MIANYFKIAWRIIIRQKVFSLINILGLAIGMAACLLIVQYISFELSYDNFHKNAANIYRIKHQNFSQGNLTENMPKTYSAVGPALKANFPEVQDFTRVSKVGGLVTAQQADGALIAFNENRVYQADPSFLRIFSFPMTEGNSSALNNPNTVVISGSIAKKYFPNQEAVGKTIRIQQQASGTDIKAMVTGVFKDVPANSHLQFDFLVSGDAKAGDWVYPESYTYISLSPQTNPEIFDAKLPSFIKKYAVLSGQNAASFTQGKTNINNINLSLQPLKDIHLYSNLPNEISNGGNGNLVWYLGIIAVLILLIAYINYVNLSTAKVIERAKEVGIRKVLGSQRSQLIRQFLFESLLLNVISVAVAVFIVMLCMPWFSTLCGVEIGFTLWKNPYYALGFVVFLAAGILLSATYPALILSDYKPVQILKGKFMNNTQNISLRKSLVVFQFVATIAFMMGTMVVYRQVNYMKANNLGMDMKQTLVVLAPQNIRVTDADAANFTVKDSVFQTEVARNPRVKSITSSSSIPGESIDYIMSYTRHTQTGEKSLRLSTLEIGNRYLNQFKVNIIDGEKINPNSNSVRNPMMLNEAAVMALGFKNAKDAVGKLIETKNARGRAFENEVVGVIQNFHQTSLKDDYTPLVVRAIDPSSVSQYEVKFNNDDLPQAIAQIEKTYKNIFPEAAFQYFFLDEFFDQQYKVEQHFGQVFSLFSGFAIFVACLGLFGLTLITISQRVKEIGIRKVLGASVQNILLLISKDFIGLILMANAIALPLAYWGCHKWLENYKFRIGFSAWFFITPMAMVFLIAILTVSYQSIKAALANPVKSLRSE